MLAGVRAFNLALLNLNNTQRTRKEYDKLSLVRKVYRKFTKNTHQILIELSKKFGTR